MFKFKSIVLCLCLLGILFSTTAFAQEYRTITVNGSATLKVVPDKASVVISIENTDKDSAVASKQNAQMMQKLQSAMLGLSITKDKLKTTNYNLYPVYDLKDNKKITGYTVNNELTIEVDNVESVGKVIDTAINLGATNIRSINFGLQDQDKYKAQALKKAVDDAKNKAQIIATSLDKNVINIVSVSEGNTYIQPRTINSAMYAKANNLSDVSTPIQSGDINIKADITIVFEIN